MWAKGYDGRELIHNFVYTFRKGDRIGIVGPNGMGKTTLLKMITGEVRPDNGQVIQGDTVQFGHYTQSDLEFESGQRVIDLVKEVADVVRLGNGPNRHGIKISGNVSASRHPSSTIL